MRPSRVLTVGFVLVCGLAAGQAASAAPTPAPSPSATPSATPAATATTPAPDPNDPPDQVEVPEVSTLAAPSFQLPFPCGQSWTGNSSASSAHRSYEIDFNRGSTANADLGDTVVAAAAGTVVISAHQGSANGYGNLVKIDHGGGYTTYYAHLNTRSVAAGAQVAQGQKIGTLGNTSKPGNNISPHLHYEVRQGTSYPSNVRKAVFNGVTFGYPNQTLTSKNKCGGGTTNPHTATSVCGAGYKVIDSAALGTAGTAYLLYNSANGNNCVATIKKSSLGKATATSAYLEVQGKTRVTDSGSFAYYAGPVRAAAAGKCVKWGGKAGTASYDSPFEHCG
ncbi:murein DD-endopeptidase MepM/ murein hydrolase activator NlpD [Nonomuraea thailandensis]|uniref:Murein DD-endopeptidase MepM/ murein hydrolase activator NlpD n=1 Tax=Nonomuraea thailandensis TaxID=1188745 RepID=A0A9X2GER4_9ACTN|nr:M23 family metallopeptidase [Nonomuraea thailandensis]MCP2356430.1 murein DD-endopeptidase MepM/ murein hydrolase activator NlpD [Nonomuraea thailandensis]